MLRALSMVSLGNGLAPVAYLNALMGGLLHVIWLEGGNVVASAFVSLAGILGSSPTHLGSSPSGGKNRRKDQKEEVSITCATRCERHGGRHE